ncbi:MAG: L-alanine-DL-glutamate epimerase [bacterium]|nr:L-alanine-DL-glutamate epimerase [bacterium]
MKIRKVSQNFDIEPFKMPLGFKGGYLTGVWQTIVSVETEDNFGIGLGTQSVLWSDADVFSSHSEAGGNALMFSVTEYASRLLVNREIESPISFLETYLEDIHSYAKKITGKENLRKTFTLNSLVALDNALWVLYAKEKGKMDFFEMIPSYYRETLKYKHSLVACIPLMSYAVPLEDIGKAIKDGFFTLKIKIGSDPEKDGDREKMLKWDTERIKSIHERFGDIPTPYTENGKLPYYFDANGRYDSKERLWKLIDFIDKIGALEMVIIMEEPFPEEMEVDVSEFPVRLVADESAHTDEDVVKRKQMGYKGVALKPIAKTLSMTLKIVKEAERMGMDYFCADLTVIPPLLEWNKNLASRLKPLPGLKIPVVESNGHQHYRDWDKLIQKHPYPSAEWVIPFDGIFHLTSDFYEKSGGIFDVSDYYKSKVRI